MPRGYVSRRAVHGVLVGAAGIAVVTAMIWALRDVVSTEALGGLYVLAILPVAIWWGLGPALVAVIVSAVAFDFFFLPPHFSIRLQEPQHVAIVVIFGVTAYVVSVLAGHARQRALEAEALAREQAGLRRVATLVARAAPPEEVFAAVAAEAGQLLDCDFTLLNRYDPDGEVTVVGAWSGNGRRVPLSVGSRTPVEGPNTTTLVFQTHRPARIDHHDADAGQAPATMLDVGSRSSVGAPISVEGRLWGVLIAAAREGPLPPDTEARLDGFTELVASALASAEARGQLVVSRARIVATADATRFRIERDLHDGVQQHLVSLALQLRLARSVAPDPGGELAERLDGLAAELTDVLDELREIARGMYPAALAKGGLSSALKGLAHRSSVPVRLRVRHGGRFPEQVEVAAYYVVAEALTNAVKHAQASVVDVDVAADEGVLHVRVHDDGCGGADVAGGSGLVGLTDRVEALGGQFTLWSPPGAGTTVQVALPLRDSSQPPVFGRDADAPDVAGRNHPAHPQ